MSTLTDWKSPRCIRSTGGWNKSCNRFLFRDGKLFFLRFKFSSYSSKKARLKQTGEEVDNAHTLTCFVNKQTNNQNKQNKTKINE